MRLDILNLDERAWIFRGGTNALGYSEAGAPQRLGGPLAEGTLQNIQANIQVMLGYSKAGVG